MELKERLPKPIDWPLLMYETIPMLENCIKLKPTEQRKALLQLIWWPPFARKKRQCRIKQSQAKQTTVVIY
jgi:hypothetical protein